MREGLIEAYVGRPQNPRSRCPPCASGQLPLAHPGRRPEREPETLGHLTEEVRPELKTEGLGESLQIKQ